MSELDQATGGCLCGQVRFTARGAPLRVGVCHCRDCRKHHGAVFYAAAVFREDQVIVEGRTSAYQGRHFCPKCGSSVFARSGTEIELHLGAFDEISRFSPQYELWTDRREEWLPDFEGTICYARDRE